jgi:hypothetical protein
MVGILLGRFDGSLLVLSLSDGPSDEEVVGKLLSDGLSLGDEYGRNEGLLEGLSVGFSIGMIDG